MYSLDDLKPRLSVGTDWVECPVRGCVTNVPRQTGQFRAIRGYRCPYHGIFISATTFEYEDARRNFPLLDDAEWEFEEQLHERKPRDVHRIARERSEEAIIENVFRGLERAKGVAPLVEAITGRPQASAWVTHLSHSRGPADVPPTLLAAQTALERTPTRAARPDLIIETPTELLFVEAKITSSNTTTQHRPRVLRRWARREGWYKHVFRAPIQQVAVEHRRYHLMQLWMLGTWMAAHSGRRFTLVVITRGSRDKGLQREFRRLAKHGGSAEFIRWTWEQVAEQAARSEETLPVHDYLVGKSLGYDSMRRLRAMCSPEKP